MSGFFDPNSENYGRVKRGKIGETPQGYAVWRELDPDGDPRGARVIHNPDAEQDYYTRAILDAILNVARQCAYPDGEPAQSTHRNALTSFRATQGMPNGGNSRFPRLFVKALEEAMPFKRTGDDSHTLETRAFIKLFEGYAQWRIFNEVYGLANGNLDIRSNDFNCLVEIYMPSQVAAERKFWHDDMQGLTYNYILNQTPPDSKGGCPYNYINDPKSFTPTIYHSDNDERIAIEVLTQFKAMFAKEVDKIIQHLREMQQGSNPQRTGASASSLSGSHAGQGRTLADGTNATNSGARSIGAAGGNGKTLPASPFPPSPPKRNGYDPRGNIDDRPVLQSRLPARQGFVDALSANQAALVRLYGFDTKGREDIFTRLRNFIIQHSESAQEKNTDPEPGRKRIATLEVDVKPFNEDELYALLARATELVSEGIRSDARDFYNYNRGKTARLQPRYKMAQFLSGDPTKAVKSSAAGDYETRSDWIGLADRLMTMLESTGGYFIATKERIEELANRTDNPALLNSEAYFRTQGDEPVLCILPDQMIARVNGHAGQDQAKMLACATESAPSGRLL